MKATIEEKEREEDEVGRHRTRKLAGELIGAGFLFFVFIFIWDMDLETPNS